MLQDDPMNLENYDALADWYEENGDDEKAVKVLKDALENVEMGRVEMDEASKNSYVTSYYLDIASLLGGLSRFSESNKYLDLAMNYNLSDEGLHQLYCYRANNFYHSYIIEEKSFEESEFVQACEWAQKGIDLSPDEVGKLYMYELLSQMYVELNDTKKTEEYANKTVKLTAKIKKEDPEAVDEYFAYVPYSYAAECYFNVEDIPNAIRLLLECESAGNQYDADETFMYSTYTSLGQCYSFEGAHNLALAYFEKAQAIDADDAQLQEWITKLKEIIEVDEDSQN